MARVLVGAALGLEGSPNLVVRMLEACPEARVIVLSDDHDADLPLAAIRMVSRDQAFAMQRSMELELTPAAPGWTTDRTAMTHQKE